MGGGLPCRKGSPAAGLNARSFADLRYRFIGLFETQQMSDQLCATVNADFGIDRAQVVFDCAYGDQQVLLYARRLLHSLHRQQYQLFYRLSRPVPNQTPVVMSERKCGGGCTSIPPARRFVS
jgi:hypothetical protein